MKVACHLITWGDDTETGLAEASALGYRACETFTHLALRYEDDVPAFLDLLGAQGFQLSALYAGGRFTDPAQREEVVAQNVRVARFLAACGADRIVFGPGGPRRPEGTSYEELKIAAATIDEAARRCADLGVRACVHPHMWTELQAGEEIDAVLGLTNPEFVWFAPDTAHLQKAGLDPVAVMRKHRERIAYCHLKDVSPDEGDPDTFPILKGDEPLPVFCELGLGGVDLPAAVGFLRDTGYDGWVTIEIDQSTSTPYESLRICRDYAVSRLGLTL